MGTATASAHSCIVESAGGEIVHGRLIELLAPFGADLQLLLFDGSKPFIAGEIPLADKVLRPVPLSTSVREAVALPACMNESQTHLEFAPAVARALADHVELTESQLAVVGMSILRTWQWDFVGAPFTLLLHGDVEHTMALFGVLSAAVRRGLCLADLSSATLRSLPLQIKPTLLINRGRLSQQLLSTLKSSSYPGFWVPGSRDVLLNLAAPRVLFLGDDDVPNWTDRVISVRLPPLRRRRWFNQADLARLRSELQPMGLMFRLRYWADVIRERSSAAGGEQDTASLGDFCGSRELATRAQEYLTDQDEKQSARRSREPQRAIVEVLWGPMHAGAPISVSDVAGRLNALLRARGELVEFRSEQVGFILKDLGIPRRRGQREKRVEFTREISQRLHELAASYQLEREAAVDCPDCAARKDTEPKAVM